MLQGSGRPLGPLVPLGFQPQIFPSTRDSSGPGSMLLRRCRLSLSIPFCTLAVLVAWLLQGAQQRASMMNVTLWQWPAVLTNMVISTFLKHFNMVIVNHEYGIINWFTLIYDGLHHYDSIHLQAYHSEGRYEHTQEQEWDTNNLHEDTAKSQACRLCVGIDALEAKVRDCIPIVVTE